LESAVALAAKTIELKLAASTLSVTGVPLFYG
jgi:hypothetical protein